MVFTGQSEQRGEHVNPSKGERATLDLGQDDGGSPSFRAHTESRRYGEKLKTAW